MDTASGDLYYCNLRTGESSWEPPPKVPPPTPQETASLLAMPVAMPRSAAPARFVNPDSNSTRRRRRREASSRSVSGSARRSALGDAAVGAVPRSARRSPRGRRLSFHGASRYAADAVEAVTKTVLDVAPDVAPGVAAAAQKKPKPRAWRAGAASGRAAGTSTSRRPGGPRGRCFLSRATRTRLLPLRWKVFPTPEWPVTESVGARRRPRRTRVSCSARRRARRRRRRSRARETPPVRVPPGSRAEHARFSCRRRRASTNRRGTPEPRDDDAGRRRGRGRRAQSARAEGARGVLGPLGHDAFPAPRRGRGTAAPSPATLAKMEVLKRRSSSAREREAGVRRAGRAGVRRDDIAVATESRRVAETTSVSPLTSTLSRKTSLVSSSPSSPTAFPSPSPRVSEQAHRGAARRRGARCRCGVGPPNPGRRRQRRDTTRSRRPPRRSTPRRRCGRARGVPRAQTRPRDTSAGGDEVGRRGPSVPSDERDERGRATRGPSRAPCRARSEAERSRESVPPGLMIKESFNDRRPDVWVGRKQSRERATRRDATPLGADASVPEPNRSFSRWIRNASRTRGCRSRRTRRRTSRNPLSRTRRGRSATTAGVSGFVVPPRRAVVLARTTRAPRRRRAVVADPSRAHPAAARGAGRVERRRGAVPRAAGPRGRRPELLAYKKARAQTGARSRQISSLFFTRAFSKDAEPFREKGCWTRSRGGGLGAAMRGEWYCQVLKQTSNHPNAERELRVWRLVYLAACAFAPSEGARAVRAGACAAAAAGKAASADTKSLSERDGEADSKILFSREDIHLEKRRRRVRRRRGPSTRRRRRVDARSLAAALAQGASLGVLGDETRARAADRAFLDIDAIPRSAPHWRNSRVSRRAPTRAPKARRRRPSCRARCWRCCGPWSETARRAVCSAARRRTPRRRRRWRARRRARDLEAAADGARLASPPSS